MATTRQPRTKPKVDFNIMDKDQEIRDFIKTLGNTEVYTEYEAKVLSKYNGCSDSNYSDMFLERLWARLSEIVYFPYQDYEPVSLFLTNSIGAKILKNAPKNSDIYSLNGDTNCYIVSKAIMQHMKFDWEPKAEFGCLSIYFSMPYKEFIGNKYKLIINTFEHDNKYYKSTDIDKKLTELPYYLYCFERSVPFCDGYICSVIPIKYKNEFENFVKNYKIVETVGDVDHVAYIIKTK